VSGKQGPRWGLRALALVGILAACYGLAVLVARPHVPDPATNPYVGKRGASRAKSAGLAIRYRRGEEVGPVVPQTLLRAGDVLDFKVRADGPIYLEVRFKDGASPPQTIFPAGGATAVRVNPGDTLPVTPAIGASPGKVVVTAIFSDTPSALGTPPGPDSRAVTAVVSKD
jgi:hypothetical protein